MVKDGGFLIQGGHMETEECENANMDWQGGGAGTLKKVQRRANHIARNTQDAFQLLVQMLLSVLAFLSRPGMLLQMDYV